MNLVKMEGPRFLMVTDEAHRIKHPGGQPNEGAEHTLRIKGQTCIIYLSGFNEMASLKMDSYKALAAARAFVNEDSDDPDFIHHTARALLE